MCLMTLFVFSKAHTKDAKKWLDMFEKSKDELDRLNKQPGEDYSVISEHHFESKRHTSAESKVPVLVCMTFADRLLAEMLDEEGKYNPAVTKKDIAKHFEVSSWHNHSVCVCVCDLTLLKSGYCPLQNPTSTPTFFLTWIFFHLFHRTFPVPTMSRGCGSLRERGHSATTAST